MTSPVENLDPGAVWEHFDGIRRIPRCSGNEEGVRRYVLDLADRKGLPARTDDAGNVVVEKPASPGYEDHPGVVLQNHLDMVCEKNADSDHDFRRDPIDLVRDGDWITAKGTTLGADNGIGVAMALAVLDDESLVHPRVEGLFTVDEETGLTGALALESDFIRGRVLLNLDSEEEGALYIGCAGGQNTLLQKAPIWEEMPEDLEARMVVVGGLRGGHSGLDIHEGLGNAIKLLARFLCQADEELDLRISDFAGGNLHNAIPREALAVVAMQAGETEALEKLVSEYDEVFGQELRAVDPGVLLEIAPAPLPDRSLAPAFARQMIKLLHAMPHGVSAMSAAVPGLVETSTNLAVVKVGDHWVEITTSQRSSVTTALTAQASEVRALGELHGYACEEGSGYPAWPPNPGSPLLEQCRKLHVARTGEEPEIKAIHAGLECGLIGEKYPGMDMISFGPDIRGAHSPGEAVKVDSVARIWEYLCEILAAL